MHEGESDSVFDLPPDRGVDGRIRISQHDWTDAHAPIDEFVSVYVAHARASSTLDIDRRHASDVLSGTLRQSLRRAGNQTPRAFEQPARLRDVGKIHRYAHAHLPLGIRLVKNSKMRSAMAAGVNRSI